LSEALIARGAAVTGVTTSMRFTRASERAATSRPAQRPGFRFVEADVARDPVPLDGIEAVIHLAAKARRAPSARGIRPPTWKRTSRRRRA